MTNWTEQLPEVFNMAALVGSIDQGTSSTRLFILIDFSFFLLFKPPSCFLSFNFNPNQVYGIWGWKWTSGWPTSAGGQTAFPPWEVNIHSGVFVVVFLKHCFDLELSWVEQDPLELLQSVEICIKVDLKYKDQLIANPKPGSGGAVKEGRGLPGPAERSWDHQPERNHRGLAQVRHVLMII